MFDSGKFYLGIMRRFIVVIVVLAGLCLLNAKSQTIGWLGVSSNQVKSEIEQMFQMEEKALEQEIMNFEESGNWLDRTDYLREGQNITNQELMRRFQVIRNEERLVYENVNIAIEDWMIQEDSWILDANFYVEREDVLLMSDWMFDDEFWKLYRFNDEECVDLEDWMFEADFFVINKD